MNYKGIYFLFIFIIVHFIVFIYFSNKYSYKNNDVSIKYVIPPDTFEDYFEFQDLSKYYDNLFGKEKKEINLIKYDY